jgi:hypothetical protein
MQRLEDRLDNVVGSREHIVVPKTQHTKARGPQKVIPSRVIRHLLDVLASVQLNDNSGIGASEVADMEPDLMLSAEFESAQLATAQAVPEETFGLCRVSAEVANMAAHAVS